jgi:hypothetical protein
MIVNEEDNEEDIVFEEALSNNEDNTFLKDLDDSNIKK